VIVRKSKIAQKSKPRARHAHYEVEFTGVEALDELKCAVVVVKRAFLNRRGDERIAALAADQGFHFFRAPAFETEDF
jgi:hypothetical protein